MAVSVEKSVSPKRIMVVFGTRPEAVKMLPVVLELKRRAAFETIVVTTGQHRSMLEQVFKAFGERADLDLKLMTHNQTLASITAKVIAEMANVYERHRPQIVLVQGDTTTAMAAAIAAYYARAVIGHIEAGLRSYDLNRPWPEEFNRVTIDGFADLMFAPTEISARNLRQEYNRHSRIVVTGNTGIDAIMQISKTIDTNAGLLRALDGRYGYLDPSKRLIVVTGHRRESFGPGFDRICAGLSLIAQRADVQLLYPVHLNPNVREVVNEKLGNKPNIRLIEPVEYVDMAYLMKRAFVLLTDSGGIQEEGPALGRPVLVMREVTERPEAVEAGAARLVGTDPQVMHREVNLLLDDASEYAKRSRPVFPYGDGHAAQRIADVLETFEKSDALKVS